jgi:hypothetical protein
MAEHLTVDQAVEGSTPFAHPKIYKTPVRDRAFLFTPTECLRTGAAYHENPTVYKTNSSYFRTSGKKTLLPPMRRSVSFQPFQGIVIQRLPGMNGFVTGL